MKYVYVDYKDGGGWDDTNDPNKGTTLMTDAQAELVDLKDSGYGAKYGPAFPDIREAAGAVGLLS